MLLGVYGAATNAVSVPPTQASPILSHVHWMFGFLDESCGKQYSPGDGEEFIRQKKPTSSSHGSLCLVPAAHPGTIALCLPSDVPFPLTGVCHSDQLPCFLHFTPFFLGWETPASQDKFLFPLYQTSSPQSFLGHHLWWLFALKQQRPSWWHGEPASSQSPPPVKWQPRSGLDQ